MKILVLSDSHGAISPMERAVEQVRPNYILHLGDRERDAQQLEELFPEIPVLSVPGNCDYPPPGAQLALIREFGGIRVFMTHGHRYHVKSGLLSLELAAREAGANVAVFGHTHRAFCDDDGGLCLMNPGACSGNGPSCGVIQIENGKALCYTMRVE